MRGARAAVDVTAIIQARMGSTRLPGKSLAEIEGKPLLEHVMERVRASRTVQRIVLATTTEASDDVLADQSARLNVCVYRGAVNDVLDRYYRAAQQFQAGVVVRVTADDPFKDPEVIDHVVGRFFENASVDYASNTIEPTYPEGLDIEVFSFQALEQAWKEAVLNSDREHVTPYIWRQPQLFRILNVKHDPNLSHLRWTLDYEADLHFARAVYARLYDGRVFLMKDILSLLEREPSLTSMNSGIPRNAGWLRSIEADRPAGRMQKREL